MPVALKTGEPLPSGAFGVRAAVEDVSMWTAGTAAVSLVILRPLPLHILVYMVLVVSAKSFLTGKNSSRVRVSLADPPFWIRMSIDELSISLDRTESSVNNGPSPKM
jgi:hypothetical protein